MGGRTLLGIPAFIYRECLGELGRWMASAVRRRRPDTFYFECRVRYFLSYIATRRARRLLDGAA